MQNLALAEAVHAMPGPVFAALDGGQFEDLPKALDQARLKGESLFLGQSGPETQKFGPWLADTYSESSLNRLLDLIGDRPAAVFWTCSGGPQTLFRHLRRINLAIVPVLSESARARIRAAELRGAVIDPQVEDYVATPTLFRHFDPRVLAQVLPVLDDAQLAQVLGPASLIVFPAERGGAPLRAQARSPASARGGELRLTVSQVREIEAVRSDRSDRRIAAFLRLTAPDGCAGVSERDLLKFVNECDEDVRDLGVTHERTIGKWALLAYLTRGRIAEVAALRAYVATPGGDPNAAFERVYSESLKELVSRQQAGRL